MAATVIITRWVGPATSPNKYQIDSGHSRANAYDGHTAGPAGPPGSTTANGSIGGDVTHPIQIPNIGSLNRSYWVSTRLMVTSSPVNSLSNIRWYTEGSNNLAADGINVDCAFAEATGYVTATGMDSVSGDELKSANHSMLLTTPASPWQWNVRVPYGPVQFYNWTSIAPAFVPSPNPPYWPPADAVQPSQISGAWSWGNFIVYQLIVKSTATPGRSGATTFSWMYDET